MWTVDMKVNQNKLDICMVNLVPLGKITSSLFSFTYTSLTCCVCVSTCAYDCSWDDIFHHIDILIYTSVRDCLSCRLRNLTHAIYLYSIIHIYKNTDWLLALIMCMHHAAITVVWNPHSGTCFASSADLSITTTWYWVGRRGDRD